ncbi:hypothetical protein BHU61_13250 (plasmid) [Macrococcus epidermidis]|uniref:Uncharacterized protein n=1 Tax=Macrococcus epidermidis TaxID=1902580 RepID=A0A327ZR70_9STAP|nr:hypothetical protein [Macrococcus epidermidis]RAK43558.1 hypothetical protein BHU61_13250 [Macrococcus epidermidis]
MQLETIEKDGVRYVLKSSIEASPSYKENEEIEALDIEIASLTEELERLKYDRERLKNEQALSSFIAERYNTLDDNLQISLVEICANKGLTPANVNEIDAIHQTIAPALKENRSFMSRLFGR